MTESIQRMTMEHLDQVLEIERVCFRQPWSENAFISELLKKTSICLVALAPGGAEVAGYVCAEGIMDEGHVYKLAVREDSRRLGIGRTLALQGIGALRARGGSRAYLELRAANVPALELYKSLGCKVIGRRKKYYTAPEEDAVLMELWL